MPDPTWETPARLNGLPATNWKRRTGVTMDGTVAECLERWLGLPHHQQQNCDLGWGPTPEGHSGTMSAGTLTRYIQRNGLPPQMAARYQNAAAALARFLNVPEPEIRNSRAEHFADAAAIARGYGR